LIALNTKQLNPSTNWYCLWRKQIFGIFILTQFDISKIFNRTR
jgi:hypothetical protein